MHKEEWIRILRSNNFGVTNVDLLETITNFVKKICKEEVSFCFWSICCLPTHPSWKNPGLTIERLENYFAESQEKLLCQNLSKTLLQQMGSRQVCVGQEAGSETAIYAIEKIFKEESTEPVLVVHSANGFSSINSKMVFDSISIVWPGKED